MNKLLIGLIAVFVIVLVGGLVLILSSADSTGTSAGGSTGPKWTVYPSTDVTPGQNQWTMIPATVDDAKAKCASTPGCVGFVIDHQGAYGRTASTPLQAAASTVGFYKLN